ncbi:flagellar basal body protein FliL [Paenibacillaceae bacterium]|nr:flagellar basal body protein FliL [Paenibacillaceae bacterium]
MKKMLPWLITILLSITLIAVVAVFLFNQLFSNPNSSDPLTKAEGSVDSVQVNKLTAKQRVDLTSQISDITTNLIDSEYIVRTSMAFRFDTKKAKEDFEKVKDLDIKPIIIRTLGDMSPEEINGSKGKDALSAKLLNLINPVLPSGKLTKIEITDFIINQL